MTPSRLRPMAGLVLALALALAISCACAPLPAGPASPTSAQGAIAPSATPTSPAQRTALPALTSPAPADTAAPATASPSPTLVPPATPARAVPSPALSDVLLSNGTYVLPDLGPDPVRLSDGKYERQYGTGASQVNLAGFVSAAPGDLDADGASDAAVVLWWNGGGSGTFYQLIAVLNQGGSPRQAAVVALGDRVGINKVTVEGGRIAVDMLAHSPQDALCCPSEHVLRTFQLQGDRLALASESRLATPSPTAPPAKAPAATAAGAADEALSRMRYLPELYRCSPEPPRMRTDRSWQVSAPRAPIAAGASAEVGLRNKFGEAGEIYDIAALVIRPDGTLARAGRTLTAAEWANLAFPRQFSPSSPAQPGLYTVAWLVQGDYVACDGFLVSK